MLSRWRSAPEDWGALISLSQWKACLYVKRFLLASIELQFLRFNHGRATCLPLIYHGLQPEDPVRAPSTRSTGAKPACVMSPIAKRE